MDQLINVLRAIAFTLLLMCAFKSILGYHFPWEKCECCKKKWGDHK